eukprot:TRINITY_DN3154_c0_g2_i2.p2 TRINITY_DN3154_c0_g2~~TRINITY_DN3154_c0_g2_i2.p2  ORF type:complete len:197 (+),score=32.63 TRINITY_DN3154_c0_g2_i2:234-824(+)
MEGGPGIDLSSAAFTRPWPPKGCSKVVDPMSQKLSPTFGTPPRVVRQASVLGDPWSRFSSTWGEGSGFRPSASSSSFGGRSSAASPLARRAAASPSSSASALAARGGKSEWGWCMPPPDERLTGGTFSRTGSLPAMDKHGNIPPPMQWPEKSSCDIGLKSAIAPPPIRSNNRMSLTKSVDFEQQSLHHPVSYNRRF